MNDRYINREVSWLAFNRRVLEEAQDQATPLLERAKFLAIVSSNLDEFVMVRYPELRAIVAGTETVPNYVGDPRADLAVVRAHMRSLVDDQGRCWRDEIVPALAAVGTVLVGATQWSEIDREAVRRLYLDKLEPVLTPLGVDPARPFPLLANRGLHVAVRLAAEKGGAMRHALVSVPLGSRFVALPGDPGRWSLTDEIVEAHLGTLFPGFQVLGSCRFRLTRDGTLDIDEEETSDLLSEIEQELSSREHGTPVRLELADGADVEVVTWLRAALAIPDEDVFAVDVVLDLTLLFGLGDRVQGEALRDAPLTVVRYPSEEQWEDPFARIREGEFILHHPYQSFAPVVELAQRAAADPAVLAIKQTLYRVSGDSPLVKALIEAARAGKQVTVLIELKARFDEAANIRWARRLEEAGAHVVYGLVGYKVHAKLLMIIRRESDGIRRYLHLGTGNYNDKTARLYTDLSYFTCNEAVGRDVAALFNMLTGYSEPPHWERLAVAPLTLRSSFVAWIRREADLARAGKGGRIIAKFNSLVDFAIVDELYAASQAGVEIDLIVRGMCILRAGVKGLSETIRVRSLIGRFLEHHRIYYFANQETATSRPVVAMASADWMSRNLDRRVECLVRIEDETLQERLLGLLDIALADNTQARVMGPDGVYVRLQPPKRKAAVSTVVAWTAEAQAHAQAKPLARKSGPRFRPVVRPKV